MELGKLGVWCFTDTLNPAQLTELAQHTERLGYGTLWYVEAFGYESFSLGSFLLNQTESLIIASGISNIYGRERFRRRSVTAEVCRGMVSGLGWYGYTAALDALVQIVQNPEPPS